MIKVVGKIINFKVEKDRYEIEINGDSFYSYKDKEDRNSLLEYIYENYGIKEYRKIKHLIYLKG